MLCQFLLYNSYMNQLYVYIYHHIPSVLRLPPTLPIPSLQVITKHRADLPVLCSCFPLAIYFTFGSVYMSMPLSHFIPAYPSPAVPSRPFSTSVSLFWPCHWVHQYCFLNSIYMRQHTVFVFLLLTYFTLYDSPSTSVQMTQFCSFSWLSNIPPYICTTPPLSIHLLMDIQVASMSWLL